MHILQYPLSFLKLEATKIWEAETTFENYVIDKGVVYGLVYHPLALFDRDELYL